MRTEKQMFNLILSFAKEDINVRAVYLNGSRANPKAEKDNFQDYDIVYAVEKTELYIKDKKWIKNFGEMAILQEPDNSFFFKEETNPADEQYAFLMQFVDGTRIDLTFMRLDIAKVNYFNDALTVLLLDKDKVFPKLPKPSDRSYYVQKPTEGSFLGICNEFWWVSAYVAKGLRRNQLIYALDHLNFNTRIQLIKLLELRIGVDNDFNVNAGKNATYFPKYLPQEIWGNLLKTYPLASRNKIWQALFLCCDMFDRTARYVAKKLNYKYNENEARRARKYLEDMKNKAIN